MAEFDLECIIKSGVEKALNEPIINGKSIMQWAEIGMKASQWVSVKSALPEGECIAYSSKFGGMMMGFISETDESDTGYCCDSNTEWLSDVTHWMPLPDPPKENNN